MSTPTPEQPQPNPAAGTFAAPPPPQSYPAAGQHPLGAFGQPLEQPAQVSAVQQQEPVRQAGPESAMSEQVAADAQAAKTVKPAGSPNLWPFLHLPRRQKAQFFHKLEGLPVDAEGNFELDMSHADMGDAAKVYDLLADIEDAMRLSATDTGAYDEWTRSCSEQDLLNLFSWYMERFQPGEAAPSPS